MKINWKSKLTSRKFWAALVGFVTALLIAFAVPQASITQVTGIITAGATLIAYIIGEGLVDAANVSNCPVQNMSVSGDYVAVKTDGKQTTDQPKATDATSAQTTAQDAAIK